MAIDLLKERLAGLPGERILFDTIRDKIEYNLLQVGIGEKLIEGGYDLTNHKLVVARKFGYSTRKADIDRDLDPTATILYSDIELGLITEQDISTFPNLRVQQGTFIHVAQGLRGEPHQPIEFGKRLSMGQYSLILNCVAMLAHARSGRVLPSLNAELTNLEP